jgi:hypothetical protein
MGIIIHLVKLNITCKRIQMSNDKSESETTTKDLDELNWND